MKPGWKEGTKITFAGKGDEAPGRPAGDIVFVIKEQKHARFERHGNDLHTKARVPLLTALVGGSAEVVTLDGRRLTVPVDEGAQPGSVRVLRGEGMPITKQPGKKGDLHVALDVVLPGRLSDAQKAALRGALPATL